MMIIYFFDPITRRYIGDGQALSNPLEPEKPIIPGNATVKQPPQISEGQRTIFDGLGWAVEEIPVSPAPPEPTREELDAQWNAYIIAQIVTLESKSARALREISVYAGTTDSDNQVILTTAQTKLAEYESQIITLRSQLK